MYEGKNLRWDGNQLRLLSSRGQVLGNIEPDQTWSGMWRVRLSEGRRSDMLNLSRAKDAGGSLALATLNCSRGAA